MRFAGCLVLMLAACPVFSQTEEIQKQIGQTIALLRAKDFLEAKPGFDLPVFSTGEFPQCVLGKNDPAVAKLGELMVETEFFGADLKPALEPAISGPYLARVKIVGTGRLVQNRCLTLFRLLKTPDPQWKYSQEKPGELAGFAGVSAASVLRNQRTIQEFCKDRPFAELAKDPRFARLLAGLATDPGTAPPASKLDDAFALERELWAQWRRGRNHTQPPLGAFPKMPDPISGPFSPMVRKGSLEEAGFKRGATENIDAVLTHWAADDDQPFAVCIVRNGVIVLHKAYGMRDGQPMTIDTPSWMASVTKTMSASLMMMLMDRNLVKLNDPVEKYLPALAGKAPGRPLLIRNLFNHTGGLAQWPGWDDSFPDVEDRMAVAYPHLRVGEKWAYTGLGNTLGGKVIETLSGESVPLFFKRHLLDPLECSGTEVVGTHADARSIPLDMAKFGQMLLNGGSYGKWKFFSEATFQEMLPRKLTAELGPGAEKWFGLGLDGKPGKFGHGAASAATFSIDRERNLVVIMTRNKMGKNQDRYNGKWWEAIEKGLIPLGGKKQ